MTPNNVNEFQQIKISLSIAAIADNAAAIYSRMPRPTMSATAGWETAEVGSTVRLRLKDALASNKGVKILKGIRSVRRVFETFQAIATA